MLFKVQAIVIYYPKMFIVQATGVDRMKDRLLPEFQLQVITKIPAAMKTSLPWGRLDCRSDENLACRENLENVDDVMTKVQVFKMTEPDFFFVKQLFLSKKTCSSLLNLCSCMICVFSFFFKILVLF